MEVNVKVTHELGERTLQLLAGGLFAAKTRPVAETPAKPAKEEKAAPVEKPAKEVKAPKAEKQKADDFDDLDDDAKLEAIKTEVTKHTKKGKSADIKALLSHFDAARASELAAESYNDFYQAIKRYGAGESVAAITGGGDDDLA